MDTNTVTITTEEYYQLRQRADLNTAMMDKLFGLQHAVDDLERRLYELERRHHDSNT